MIDFSDDYALSMSEHHKEFLNIFSNLFFQLKLSI